MSSPFSAFGRVAPAARPTGQRMPQPSFNIAPRGLDMGQVQKFYQAVSSSQNPMQSIDKLLSSNPKFAQIKTLMKQGRTPESLFREIAAQRGIDPDEFVRQMQGNNGNK